MANGRDLIVAKGVGAENKQRDTKETPLKHNKELLLELRNKGFNPFFNRQRVVGKEKHEMGV